MLDDGNRKEVRKLTEELNVNYISRDTNEHRKAGNLNNAFYKTSGEFILALDCDFVPYPNILNRTLGFFENEKVAIVQTPQHYFMPDFHSRNLGIEGIMPSDVNMFYHYQQVIRDNFNSVVCVGTSYVARRSAIQSVGGYVTTCIIEDHQTGTKLITNGWEIVYLNEILSVGETPARFKDYLDQRLRWLQGNLQILLPQSKLNVLGSHKLTFWQKIFYTLHYDSNFLPIGRTLFIFIPLISLYFGNLLIVAPVGTYLSYAIPFVLFLHIVPSWVSNGHIHQIWHELYETIMCVPWTTRTLRIMKNPFKIFGSTITSKDKDVSSKNFDFNSSRHLIIYLVLFVVFYLTRFGLPLINPSLQFYQVGVEGQEILVLWTLYNFVMVVIALLCCIEKPYRRTAERFPADYIVRVKDKTQCLWGATVDISEMGLLIAITTKTVNLNELSSELDIELIDHNLHLKGNLIRVSQRKNELPKLSIKLDALTEEEETGIIRLIYSPDNKYMYPQKITIWNSLCLFVKSFMSSNSLLQVFSSK